jgi:predicted DsbA family dithiol-disulfide isomerase
MKGHALDHVRRDLEEARSLMITGTPTFLFGRIEQDGLLKVTRRASGAMPLGAFAAILDELLQLTVRSP